MTNKYPELDEKLMKARIQMLSRYPFFGSLAFGLKFEWDDTLNPPTAATNGKWIKFHPEFVKDLSIQETIFIVAHEVMHPALMHIIRAGNREPKKWNVACDIVVNYLLHESNVGMMPEGGIHRPDIYITAKGKVETIYDMIDLKDFPQDTDHIDGSGNGQSADEMAANWKNKLHQAVQQAKSMGMGVSGSLEQFVNQLTNPKVTWQEVLRSRIMTTRGSDRSWAKRNRRHVATGLMLPGSTGEQMGPMVFGIDCSGSTSDDMVSQCGAEIRSIQEELRPEKIHVVYWDTAVKKVDVYEPDEPMEAKVYGRGGTDVRCVWDYIENEGIEPEHVVIATDLFLGSDKNFGHEPDYPVTWAVMESSQKHAPWGEVLVVN